MDLLIDTRNGLSGDIMAAGLIGLGADTDTVTGAMIFAGNLIGKTHVSHNVTDGVNRLDISIKERPDHLHADRARKYLLTALAESGIREPWHGIGTRVLNVLIEAESHVHSHHPSLKSHFHGHETVLHEASDIIIDIMGMVAGMQVLNVRSLEYLEYVNVGSGTVTFSHGTLEVPTPATRHILETHGIPWKNSEYGMEMATPTGASMLAGCNAIRISTEPPEFRKALAGGTRPLPPVTFIMFPFKIRP
ncbi:MAG: LarC family nickel insertion protein [Candidatus Thermoplasmatota archaeon]|nr:LarC family nickel insertion protein [Euryarchaeota archaeon]MBU4032573.1 LarC family nickel insertion protein [Candidatus Thermoplasmatota archaeon]MBU4070576.1 LarC family nickel insertion protein [Candidatus Thermoplasmatota archaeon]MBU4144141.1 LarC family nickel insertion protein [Candidatus Thermoplasmatota archaeon]MBU4591169.1 LarC family nickel insertion protein [Candidatus Thermoplasmatota archaeon]